MKLIKTKINELIFWYREDDKIVGQRIALGKYEEYETMLMLSQVNKNSVVVDVGANIGYYTLLLAQKCKKVYAIEPDKESFKILKKNVEDNGFKNVVLFNVAAGNKKERLKLIIDNNNLGNSRLSSQRDCLSPRPACRTGRQAQDSSQ
jgi:predicted O-methyltransferase YrrM